MLIEAMGDCISMHFLRILAWTICKIVIVLCALTCTKTLLYTTSELRFQSPYSTFQIRE